MKDLFIRKAVKEDAAALLEYMYKIGGESDYLTFGEGELNISLDSEETIIEDNLNSDNQLFLVAVIDGKIVGNLHFHSGSRPRIKHSGEFGISVLKEYWGHGIGTELLKYMLDWAKSSKIIRKVNLRLRSDNERAFHLYSKLGFKIEGLITRDFFIDGAYFDSIAMGLLID